MASKYRLGRERRGCTGPLGRDQARETDWLTLKAGPTELVRQISIQHVTNIWNVTSTLAGRERETKEEQTRMRLVCPLVLVGSSGQAERSTSGSPPAAASRRGKYRSQAAASVSSSLLSSLSPDKPHSPDPPPQELLIHTPLNIKALQLIGRFLESKPHPVTQDPSLIGTTSSHSEFLPVNWPYPGPASFAISDPIRTNACRNPAPAFLLVISTVIIIISREWVVALQRWVGLSEPGSMALQYFLGCGVGVIDPVKCAGKLRYTEGQQLAPDWSNKLGQEQN